MNLVKAQERDIITVQKLAAKAWPSAYADILSPRQIGYMMNMMYSTPVLKEQMNNGHLFYLAYAQRELAGFAGFNPVDSAGAWKLQKLYLLPGARGKGGGRDLLLEVENLVRSKGGTKLFLNVNRYNKAVEFYNKNGYTVAETGDFDIGAGFLMTDFIMVKSLGSK